MNHQAPNALMNGTPLRGMRVVISYRTSDASIQPDDPGAESLSHLPFSRETFLELMDHFHLSHSFVRTVLRGGLHFSSNTMRVYSFTHPFRCFNMRMDNSWPRDLAMSSSTNVETGMTYALFHGCDEQDVKVLAYWLRMTTCSVGHPLLLPALFAELQLMRHKKLARDNWSKLVTLYAHTGQYGNHAQMPHPAPLQENAFDYDNTTREVLGMYQDTGFLEKGLLKLRRGLKQMASQLEIIKTNVPKARKKFIVKENARIGERLEEMMVDYEGLLAECKLIMDGASMLNNAIWNLIAQRDNIANQSIAADSRAIASAAKRDSSAMKAIALLTMTFLPGTFVASFFAMPLLDWQAPSAGAVVSHRFWIYWAVTVPLTAVVLLLWSTWYLFSGYQRLTPKKRSRDGRRQVFEMHVFTALGLDRMLRKANIFGENNTMDGDLA